MGKVNVTLRTKELRGALSRVVTLSTNDPKKPKYYLTLKASVLGSVILLPRASLSIGWQTQSTNRRLLVRKDPSEEGELVVSGLSTGKPWLKASARRVEVMEPGGDGFPAAAPGDWIVDLELGEKAQSGVSREELRFKTGLPREPEVGVPVVVTMLPAVALRPESLVLPMPAPGRQVEAPILVVVRRDVGSEALEAEVVPETFAVRLEKSGGRHYKAMVSWTDSGPDTAREGTVTFRLGEDSFEVPVRVGEPAGD